MQNYRNVSHQKDGQKIVVFLNGYHLCWCPETSLPARGIPPASAACSQSIGPRSQEEAGNSLDAHCDKSPDGWTSERFVLVCAG